MQNPLTHGEYTYIRTDTSGRPVCIFHADCDYDALKASGDLIFRFPYGTELRRKTGEEPDPVHEGEMKNVYVSMKVSVETGELVDDNG